MRKTSSCDVGIKPSINDGNFDVSESIRFSQAKREESTYEKPL
jgi:hypothetical protein